MQGRINAEAPVDQGEDLIAVRQDQQGTRPRPQDVFQRLVQFGARSHHAENLEQLVVPPGLSIGRRQETPPVRSLSAIIASAISGD